MNEKEPSAFSGADWLGPALFRAGRDEWPSDQALSKTLAAVGAGAAVVAVTGAAVGAGAGSSAVAKGGAVIVSFGSVMKWLGVGVVSGAMVAGVAHEVSAPAVAPREPVEVAARTPVVGVPNAVPATPQEGLAPALVPPPELPKPVAAPLAAERPEELERVPLAAEVALVDRARAALSGGNPSAALATLARYETQFPEPRLQPEVLFLRMEAHLAAGDRAQAKKTAAESIQRFPRSPHAARARELAGEAP